MKKNIKRSRISCRIAVTIIFMLIPYFSFSQVRIDWQNCYGNVESMDWAVGIAPTDDGFFVLGQVTHPLNEGLCSCTIENERTPWLISINRQGDLSGQYCWNDNTLNYTGICVPIDIKKANTPNGKEYYLSIHRYGQVIITKLNEDGEELWRKELGWIGTSMFPTDDGGLFLGGTYGHIDKGEIDTLFKMDSDGNTEWGLSLGSMVLWDSDPTSVYQAKDGGYYAMYNTMTGTALFRISSTGQIEWKRIYGQSKDDLLLHLVDFEDGILLGGYAFSEIEGQHDKGDAWLVCTDKEGDIKWERCFGGSYFDKCTILFHNPNDSFTVFANSYSNDGDVQSNNQGTPDVRKIWIFNVNATGELQWERSIGAIDHHVCCNDVIQTKAYNYVVAGWMHWDESHSGDVDCSNSELIPNSDYNYWVLHVTDTINSAGVNEPLSPIEVQVFPNPAKGTVYIQGIEPAEVLVYNAIGQIVKTLRDINEIGVDDLPEGLYVLCITDKEGISVTKRITVVR